MQTLVTSEIDQLCVSNEIFMDVIRQLGLRNKEMKPIQIPVVSTVVCLLISLSRQFPNVTVLSIAIMMPDFILNNLGTQKYLGNDFHWSVIGHLQRTEPEFTWVVGSGNLLPRVCQLPQALWDTVERKRQMVIQFTDLLHIKHAAYYKWHGYLYKWFVFMLNFHFSMMQLFK